MFVFSTVPCNSAPLVFFSTFRLGLLATVPRIYFHLIHPIAALWRSTVQFPGIWSQLHGRVDGCCLLEWFTLHSIKFLLVIGRGKPLPLGVDFSLDGRRGVSCLWANSWSGPSNWRGLHRIFVPRGPGARGGGEPRIYEPICASLLQDFFQSTHSFYYVLQVIKWTDREIRFKDARLDATFFRN